MTCQHIAPVFDGRCERCGHVVTEPSPPADCSEVDMLRRIVACLAFGWSPVDAAGGLYRPLEHDTPRTISRTERDALERALLTHNPWSQ